MNDTQSAGIVLLAIGVTLAIYWYRLTPAKRKSVWSRITGVG